MGSVPCPADGGGWRPCPGPATFWSWADLDEHMADAHPELAEFIDRLVERMAADDDPPDPLPSGAHEAPTHDGVPGKRDEGEWMREHRSPSTTMERHRTAQAMRAADRGGDGRPHFVT